MKYAVLALFLAVQPQSELLPYPENQPLPEEMFTVPSGGVCCLPPVLDPSPDLWEPDND